MSAVIVKQSNPDAVFLEQLGVFAWPIWSKEVSTFPWTYNSEETCYLLEGEPIRLQAGDLVIFPAGMSCTWQIRQAVRKHYVFA
jgi:hypothetical protein